MKCSILSAITSNGKEMTEIQPHIAVNRAVFLSLTVKNDGWWNEVNGELLRKVMVSTLVFIYGLVILIRQMHLGLILQKNGLRLRIIQNSYARL